MPLKNWDIHFNEFFQAYLRTSASVTAGVPAAATLPIRTAQDKDTATRPRVVISNVRRTETLQNVFDAQFTVTLHTLNDASNGTTEEQAEAWLQQIRQRLADRTALQAYIATLSTEAQTGWQPAVLHVLALPFKRDLDEETAHLQTSFDFTFTVIVHQP